MPFTNRRAEEIERKFLFRGDRARLNEVIPGCRFFSIAQRYVGDTGDWAIRVRTITEDSTTRHLMTMKRKINDLRCSEIEFDISVGTYCDLLPHCGPELQKTRYDVDFNGLTWSIDLFHNTEPELILVEIELDREEQHFEKPSWVGREVTHDPQYRNFNLAKKVSDFRMGQS